MDERARRLCAGTEAGAIGYGGVAHGRVRRVWRSVSCKGRDEARPVPTTSSGFGAAARHDRSKPVIRIRAPCSAWLIAGPSPILPIRDIIWLWGHPIILGLNATYLSPFVIHGTIADTAEAVLVRQILPRRGLMNEPGIFVSVGQTSTDQQEAFVRGVLASWKKKASEKPKRLALNRAASEFTVAELIGGLKASQLWSVLAALAALIAGAFALGAKFFGGP